MAFATQSERTDWWSSAEMFVSLAAGFYLHHREILKVWCQRAQLPRSRLLVFRRMYETQLCAKHTQNNKIEKVKSSVAEDVDGKQATGTSEEKWWCGTRRWPGSCVTEVTDESHSWQSRAEKRTYQTAEVETPVWFNCGWRDLRYWMWKSKQRAREKVKQRYDL